MLFPKRMYTNGYQQLLEVLTENEIKLKKKKARATGICLQFQLLSRQRGRNTRAQDLEVRLNNMTKIWKKNKKKYGAGKTI